MKDAAPNVNCRDLGLGYVKAGAKFSRVTILIKDVLTETSVKNTGSPFYRSGLGFVACQHL